MRALLALLLTVLCLPALALEFTYVERFPSGIANKLKISGKIVAGDHQKFLDLVRANPKDALIGSAIIELDSLGGDVREAIALAATLKNLYPKIHVVGPCASSCVLLWLAGSSRFVEGKGRIGIHRPSFLPEYFRGLSVKEAERQYTAMAEQYRQFILGQGLPQSLYEKLMATSSTEIHWLSLRDVELISIRPPYYDEKLKATCGKFLDNVMRNGTDGDKFKICDLTLARKEKADTISSIVGEGKNPDWENFRANYLKDIRL